LGAARVDGDDAIHRWRGRAIVFRGLATLEVPSDGWEGRLCGA
jgi:hypothetical protein